MCIACASHAGFTMKILQVVQVVTNDRSNPDEIVTSSQLFYYHHDANREMKFLRSIKPGVEFQILELEVV